MQTRYRAAATSLLLTATAGLAAAGVGGAAHASGTHTSDRAARQLVVTLKESKSTITASDARFRPGNTIFKVAPHAKGSDGLQVLRLKRGYSLAQASADFNSAFSGDVKAVRRVDRNVVFYGGNQMSARGGDPTYWGINIDHKGTYYVLDISSNKLGTFKVRGTHQKRALPRKDGWINPAVAKDGVTNVWRVGKHNAKSGWMRSTNLAKEPHFIDLSHVKKSTTRQQVKDCFQGSGPCNFAAKDGATASAGVISPGKTMVWSYDLTRGRYLVDCFWPSKITGMPHALMGMFKLFHMGS
jgi:hypothetical protein